MNPVWLKVVDELIEEGLPVWYTNDDAGLEREEYAEWFEKAFNLLWKHAIIGPSWPEI